LNAFKSNGSSKAGFMGQGSANMSIADVYSVIGNQLMPEFIMKRIAILRKTNDTISLAAALNAEEYANNKDYNNALAYYNESGILFKTKL
jgi:hypothetical protein